MWSAAGFTGALLYRRWGKGRERATRRETPPGEISPPRRRVICGHLSSLIVVEDVGSERCVGCYSGQAHHSICFSASIDLSILIQQGAGGFPPPSINTAILGYRFL